MRSVLKRSCLCASFLAAALGASALGLGSPLEPIQSGNEKKVAPGPQAGAAQPMKIAFIDIEDVINGYKKTKEAKKKLQDEYRDKKTKFEEDMKKINEDADELQLLSSESAEYRKKRRDLRLRALTNDFDIKLTDTLADEDLGKLYKQVYGDIQVALGALCKEEGYSAVLQVSRREILASGEKAVTGTIATRSVVWFDPAHDLTDRVVAKLNQ